MGERGRRKVKLDHMGQPINMGIRNSSNITFFTFSPVVTKITLGPQGGPMGSQRRNPWDPMGVDPWDPMGPHPGIPGWALGDPLALGDPWALGDLGPWGPIGPWGPGPLGTHGPLGPKVWGPMGPWGPGPLGPHIYYAGQHWYTFFLLLYNM